MSEFLNDSDFVEVSVPENSPPEVWRAKYVALCEQLACINRELPKLDPAQEAIIRIVEEKFEERAATYGPESVPQIALDALAAGKSNAMLARIMMQQFSSIIAQGALRSHLISAKYESQRRPDWYEEAEAMMQQELSEQPENP